MPPIPKPREIRVKDTHIEYVTPSGEVFLIDLDDEDLLRSQNWRSQKSHGKFYLVTLQTRYVNGIRSTIYFHRELFKNIPKGFEVDHISGDSTDNRKRNLRIATKSQNQANARRVRKISKSPYRGVHRQVTGTKWVAVIGSNPRKYLGSFETPEEAAMAYNDAAAYTYGPFAVLNEVKCA